MLECHRKGKHKVHLHSLVPGLTQLQQVAVRVLGYSEPSLETNEMN